MRLVPWISMIILVCGCNKFQGMTKVGANSALGTGEFYIDTFEAHIAEKSSTNSKGETTTKMAAKSLRDMDPAININFNDAKAACEAAEKRICTYNEWVAACKGPNNRRFSLQSEQSTPNDLTQVCDVDRTENDEPGALPSKTGSKPNCKTENLEVYDMIGNVTEWVSKGTRAVAAGGMFRLRVSQSHCDAILVLEDQAVSEDTVATELGFRCCKNPE